MVPAPRGDRRWLTPSPTCSPLSSFPPRTATPDLRTAPVHKRYDHRHERRRWVRYRRHTLWYADQHYTRTNVHPSLWQRPSFPRRLAKEIAEDLAQPASPALCLPPTHRRELVLTPTSIPSEMIQPSRHWTALKIINDAVSRFVLNAIPYLDATPTKTGGTQVLTSLQAQRSHLRRVQEPFPSAPSSALASPFSRERRTCTCRRVAASWCARGPGHRCPNCPRPKRN